MLSIDDKCYVLWTGTKLKFHGSGLKGKHLPIVCDKFRDSLCLAIFNKGDVTELFTQFQDLSRFSIKDFQMRIYPSKNEYVKTTLYNKLLQKLAMQGIRAVAGSSLEYVKAVDGYTPVALFSAQDRIDYEYFKDRLAEIASRILDKPAKSLRKLLASGQERLGRWT